MFYELPTRKDSKYKQLVSTVNALVERPGKTWTLGQIDLDSNAVP